MTTKKKKIIKRGRKPTFEELKGFKVWRRHYGRKTTKPKTRKGKYLIFQKKNEKKEIHIPYNEEQLLEYGIEPFIRLAKQKLKKRSVTKDYQKEIKKHYNQIEKASQKRRKKLELNTNKFTSTKLDANTIITNGINRITRNAEEIQTGDTQGKAYRELLRPIIKHERLLNDILSDYGIDKLKKYFQYHIKWNGQTSDKSDYTIDEIKDARKTIQEILEEYYQPGIRKGDNLLSEASGEYINQIGRAIDGTWGKKINPFYEDKPSNHTGSGYITEVIIHITFTKQEA